MSEQHYELLLQEVQEIKAAVTRLETELKYELEIHKHDADNKLIYHDKRISFTEKVLLTTGGVILMAVLYAVLRTIGL